MNKMEAEERKKYLALQAFYLGIKGLLEDLEKKHPEFIYNTTFKKRRVGLKNDNKAYISK